MLTKNQSIERNTINKLWRTDGELLEGSLNNLHLYSMENNVEHEICNNCKKEIPHPNYVMHTMHCARNITLCKTCKEPFPKAQFADHEKSCKPASRKAVEDKKMEARKERYMQKMDRLVDTGYSLKENSSSLKNTRQESAEKSMYRSSSNYESRDYKQNSVINSQKTEIQREPVAKKLEENATAVTPQTKKSEPKPSGLLACKFCDLELPKLELEEHENYCGTRTDKCLECGELVMFKNKQVHLDSNHGFVKLTDEPGPKPSWDSSTQRNSASVDSSIRRPPTLRSFTDFDYDPMPYLPTSYQVPGGGAKKKEGESYKEISRRLDCPAPQPPSYRRRNPPTELVIPCEFCGVPIPHEELIQHETGCRPDLARFNPRRRSPEPDDYFIAPQPSSPEVELPCEFCGDMIPASQLLGHQVKCT
ncbi:hypothetical protein JTB14_020456 [Gonioctena quinquepunctata]|nr:hypothetical protein JTB14_020456 [Gonioctena quinquepunctata]